MERINSTPSPPAPQESDKKTQKRRWRRQNTLQCFLATSATIGRKYAPDFNGANLQGVQWDSLEIFRAVGAK